jgi:hypothetical protein
VGVSASEVNLSELFLDTYCRLAFGIGVFFLVDRTFDTISAGRLVLLAARYVMTLAEIWRRGPLIWDTHFS